MPSDLTLAVDLNGNGIRDLGEPVIRQGEEPYTDTGTDGVADAQEPGYDPVNNPDPERGRLRLPLNPNGTENDHVWEPGEPYQDVGLDGVPNTPQQANGGYDVGEGDGEVHDVHGRRSSSTRSTRTRSCTDARRPRAAR